MQKYSLVLLFFIALLGFGLRLYKLTSSPEGLYIDETSIAYNAWSIVETGKDQHGKSWPLFFEAFGEWKLPVYIYSVAAVQMLAGPEDFTVRIPGVIFGTLSILFLGLFTRELLIKELPHYANQIALLGALLLAIAPWHIQFTHTGFEVSAAVCFYISGLWLFVTAKNRQSTRLLIFSLVSFALALYAYNSARIVVPLTLIILFVLFRTSFSFKSWFVALLVGAVVTVPFWNFALSPAGQVRARQISFLYEPKYEGQKGKLLVQNYLANLSPFYIFFRGDPTIAHASPFRMGLHYPIELLFFLVGMGVVIGMRKRGVFLPMVLFLIGFIPPAVTTLGPHALRGLMAIPGTCIISALGAVFLIKRLKIRWQSYAWILTLGTLFIFTARFLYIYHRQYVPSVYIDWQLHTKKISDAVKNVESDYDVVYFEKGRDGIAMWWHLRIPPSLVLSVKNRKYLGKYRFDTESFSEVPWGERVLYVSTKAEKEGRKIGEVDLPDGRNVANLYAR